MAQQKPDCAKAKATREGKPITAGARKRTGDGKRYLEAESVKRLRSSRSRLEAAFQRHLATSDAATRSQPIHGLRCTSIRAHLPILKGEKLWSTPNTVPHIRISTHTSFPLENTEPSSRLLCCANIPPRRTPPNLVRAFSYRCQAEHNARETVQALQTETVVRCNADMPKDQVDVVDWCVR